MLSNLFKPTRNIFISPHSNTHTNKLHILSPQFPPTLQLQQPCPSRRLINNNKPSASQMPNPKLIAEYAKSARSSCKTCSNKIPDKALRLGLVTKDPRGYDSTKWFHLQCFSNSIDSVDVIQDFDSLKEFDKETLKKLVDESKSSAQNTKREFENEGEVQLEKVNLKKSKMSQEECDQDAELEENGAKNTKLSVASEEAKLEIKFSSSDCKDKYKDAKLMPKWKAFRSIIFLERDDGLNDSSKIAAFDFDGCLAKTSVKRVGADAWSLMHSSIPNKLQCLYNDGYKLVIFTNESNIDRWKNKRQVAVDSKIGRINNFISSVGVPIQVFIACGYSDGKIEDPFRKPKPGMWRIMEKHFNSGIPIDMDQSFYVGDAAGRAQDHSDADKEFAEAIGLKFYVPEDYFGF